MATATATAKPHHLSLYRDEYPAMLVEYFEARPIGTRLVRARDDDSCKENTRIVCSEVPTFQGFASSIGVTHQVLLDWARRYPAFGQARARAKQMQEQFFADGLATGIMNPTGAIFVAKNILGWRDKIDVETTSTTVDAGQTVMSVYLRHATPELLAEFRQCLDKMRVLAMAAGALDDNGHVMQIAESAQTA